MDGGTKKKLKRKLLKLNEMRCLKAGEELNSCTFINLFIVPYCLQYEHGSLFIIPFPRD